MTPKQEAALRLALEALTHLQPTALTSFYTIGDREKAITAIREALAEQPAAPLTGLDVYLDPNDDLKPKRYPKPAAQFAGSYGTIDESAAKRIATALGWEPKREWVGLSTEEMKEIADRYHLKPPNVPVAFRAIEAKLREKNA